MGLFTPKITNAQLQHVHTAMKQLQESVHLLNSTTKPDVFFKRLNFSLDLLLDLQSYEKYNIFKESTPTNDYNAIIRNMESTVNDFIDRAIEANNQKLASLKTEAAKKRNYEKFIDSLIAAFDCANTFWSGSRGFPHYTGPLFTDNNYRRVKELFDNSCLDNQYVGNREENVTVNCEDHDLQIDGNTVPRVQYSYQTCVKKQSKVIKFLCNIPAMFFAWATFLFVIAMIEDWLGIQNMGNIGSIIYALSILITPFIITVLCFKETDSGKPFYQKWWFWLIVFVVVLIVIGSLSEPVEIPDSTPPSSTNSTVSTEGSNNPTAESTSAPLTEATITVLTPKDEFIAAFCSASGLSQECANTVYDLLSDQLLCNEITFEKKHDTGLYSYDIGADGYLLVVTVDGTTVYGASCGSYLMYDESGIKNTIKDIAAREISGYEGSYYVIAKSIVENYLVSPSTAEFASVWDCRMQRYGDIGAVQAYVDSQNAFGAMVRNDFVVQFRILDIDTLTYEILYIQIGDETAGKFIDMS